MHLRERAAAAATTRHVPTPALLPIYSSVWTGSCYLDNPAGPYKAHEIASRPKRAALHSRSQPHLPKSTITHSLRRPRSQNSRPLGPDQNTAISCGLFLHDLLIRHLSADRVLAEWATTPPGNRGVKIRQHPTAVYDLCRRAGHQQGLYLQMAGNLAPFMEFVQEVADPTCQSLVSARVQIPVRCRKDEKQNRKGKQGSWKRRG